ncbi:hypothetical protein VdG2_01404 [Verticillium dahliae VDG2]|nr:hypothetical protein VdG2_01404 [Verticillium dahliae VDG2]
MASTTASGDGHADQSAAGVSIADLPKTWHFTSSLPADSQYPTPADSHETPRNQIRPRQVRNAIFSYVRPEPAENPELLAVSPAAMRDIGIKEGDETTDEFRQTVAGNRLHGWDQEKLEGGYPWAQCYGGYQFGQWAGQLGDGRAISLFETKNPATGVQYELQLKGAGLTPYSRFADGKAVLRSSIREFIVSEALHALRIPTTRALSLTLLPNSKVRRETVEPGAIVLRFAQSWLRFGNFDILRARSERPLLRTLATYVATDAVNPNFVPRNWVLDEVIRRVEKGGERDVLRRAMHMALHPFEDAWHGETVDGRVHEGDAEEEARWVGDVPKLERAMQCSCSS